MSESKKIEDEGKLRLKAPRRIVLRKTVEGGSIKQNFSHGRSKSVVVEVRRKKTFVKAGDLQDGSEAMDPVQAQVSADKGGEASRESPSSETQNRARHQVLTPLTPEERKRLKEERQGSVVETAEALFSPPSGVEEETGASIEEVRDHQLTQPSVAGGVGEDHRVDGVAAATSAEGTPDSAGEGVVAVMAQAPLAPEANVTEDAPSVVALVDAAPSVPVPVSAPVPAPVPAPVQVIPGAISEGPEVAVHVRTGDEGGARQESVPVDAPPEQAVASGVPEAVVASGERETGSRKPSVEPSARRDHPPSARVKATREGPSGSREKSSRQREGAAPSRERPAAGAPVSRPVGTPVSRPVVSLTLGFTMPPARGGNLEEMREVVSSRPAKGRGSDGSEQGEGGVASRAGSESEVPVGMAAAMDGEARSPDDDVDKFGAKKKLTRAQKEDVARKKTEALVTKRLSQLDELREQKRLLEERRKIESEEGQGRKTLKTKVKRKGRKSVDPEAEKALSPRKGRQGRGRGGRGGREEVVQGAQAAPVGPVVRDVVIPETITVAELASRMAVKASEVVKLLFDQGMMVTINQVLDQDTAVLVVEELGHRPKTVSEEADIVAELTEAVDTEEQKTERPPVVTIMGHVDHGKTSLLDAIRKTDVASREYGGITQHIGAYQVTLKNGSSITFIDTPGHAAFTAMRSRGAKVTDIVVLVVAADDGVMPQTVEAINHAKDARVPIIVAVNKIDKVGANPDRVKQQLTEYELVAEDWGGQTIFVNVSAVDGTGIESLEEMILLQAEVLSLKTNPDKNARGTIVEAKLDKGRGAVATCLVQSGTLSEGDIFVVGQQWGKVRTLINDRGKSIQKAGPSVPVEIIGLSGVPEAGDELVTVQDEKRAKDIASFRQIKLKEQEHLRTAQPTQLDDLFNQIQKGELDEIKVVVKGDVRGSVEAVAESLMKIEHPEIRLNVIHTGVGGINESDVMLAMASDAVILGFNVRADAKAREMAKREKIDLRFYTVIYNLLEDMTRAMEGRLAPTQREVFLGSAAIREVFRISKVGNVAGCVVTQGVIPSKARVRVLRDSVIIHDGKLLALKRFKDDTKEVREGQDCGMSIEKFNDFKSGDIIEAFMVEEIRQTIAV
ncbi:MAG: translation initiation factor IF-2 [Magnetococcales bacterium]|nr:translation initiation factor IF-2 [Magnetococcales bacterium]